MNIEQLKKNVGQVVRLRPVAQRYDAQGKKLEQFDDDWRMVDVTEQGVMVRNLATDHTRTLFRDQIHHYSTDQDVQGAVRGFLILNVQMYLVGAEIQIEPAPRPGEEVDRPPPLRRPASLFERAGKLQDQRSFEARRKAFRVSQAAIDRSDQDFASLESLFEAVSEQIRQVMPDFYPTVRKQPGTISVVVLGYGGLATWRHYRNTLEGSQLTISYWEGPPPFPGYARIVFDQADEASELRSDQYTFELMPDDSGMWVEKDSGEALSTAELAELILNRIFDLAER